MTIKHLRQKANLTQKVLAQKIYCDQTTISKYEKGIAIPKIEQLPKLADILHCSIEELVFALIITKEQNDEANKNKQSNCVK